MEIFIADTYEALSKRAAEDLYSFLQPLQAPVVCPASGDTPAGLYRHLVQLVRRENTDTTGWRFVGLDEWQGMNGTDEGSCRYMLDRQLFFPLRTPAANICFFDGRAGDWQAECTRSEAFIAAQGGISIAIVGIGLNGHVGMNEPGTPKEIRSHVARLHKETQHTGQKYFSGPRHLSAGLTLGLATILEAKKIFLLASGPSKTAIVHQLLNDSTSEALPASILRQHPALCIYLDKAAAGKNA